MYRRNHNVHVTGLCCTSGVDRKHGSKHGTFFLFIFFSFFFVYPARPPSLPSPSISLFLYTGRRKRKQRPFFTISIVAKSQKEQWRAYVEPNVDQKKDLPEKYTFSLIKAAGLLQQDQIRKGEQVVWRVCMLIYRHR